MKMGFAFIILLCTMQNTQSMGDALTSLKTERQLASAAESSPAPVDNNATLIKACKCPTATTTLIGFLLGHGADVNTVVDNTTPLLAAIETQNDNDPSILHMLVPRATDSHKVLALKYAIEKEKWNTVELLQDEYNVVLSKNDIQEHHAFTLAPAIVWARNKAAAARARLSRVINNFKNPDYDSDDNDCDDNTHDYLSAYDESVMAQMGGMPQ